MTRETDPMLREQYCFGCGRHNPIGMHLVFKRDEASDGVIAWYVPRAEDQGFPHVMHGGLLALLLDEAMGWAMYADHIFAVTAKMETRYRRTVGVDAPVAARASAARPGARSAVARSYFAPLSSVSRSAYGRPSESATP